jgi:hypothetical protein
VNILSLSQSRVIVLTEEKIKALFQKSFQKRKTKAITEILHEKCGQWEASLYLGAEGVIRNTELRAGGVADMAECCLASLTA